jgi:manganese/iron transport system ATP-binding protein
MSAHSTSSPVHVGRERVHAADAPILDVRELTIRYQAHVAIEAVSFQLEEGAQVAVIGPNGAGKSTLFKAIAGVLAPSLGEVRIGGFQPSGHICIAYIPQRNQIDWSFPVSVADVVMMGRVGRLGWFRRAKQADWQQVYDCLRVVRMEELADRQIGALSGGEQQRMFIARALAQEAELMLMDEVMTACDTPARDEIYRILATLKERRVTVMVSTHDLDEAATRFDQVMLLNRELIGFGDSSTVFVPDLLKRAYGGHLRLVNTAGGALILNDSCCGGGGEHRGGMA